VGIELLLARRAMKWRLFRGTLLLIAVLTAGWLWPAHAEQATLPAGFVRLREIAPTIRQDIRYAGAFNFIGRRVPGYEAAECILWRPAAEALAQAQERLIRDGYHLKVFDCYRPERAVRAFVAWSKSAESDRMARVFSPQIDKSRLFALGYIAARSKHSLGTAVDLGLVRADEPDRPTPADAGACDGPFPARAPESSLDFGTAYDCASPLSATTSAAVTFNARQNREQLVRALAGSFRNYWKEWWHFEFTGAPQPARAYDFPVR
jgi:D-alanyl-D-alanine dipeptidase